MKSEKPNKNPVKLTGMIVSLMALIFTGCSEGSLKAKNSRTSLQQKSALSNTVLGLALVNTETGRDVRQLQGRDNLELSSYNHGLTIRALVTDDTMVAISEINGSEVDRSARGSMSLMGYDENGNYLPYGFQEGDFEVTFIPSTKINGRWTRGEPYSIQLRVTDTPVIEEKTNTVQQLVLVNSDTGSDLRILRNGDGIALSQYNHGLTVRAITSEDTMVTIAEVNGEEVNRSARHSMSLMGVDGDGNYLPYQFPTGSLEITFIPSTKIDGTWTRGIPYSLQLNVSGENSSQPDQDPVDPTPTPTPTPDPTPIADADIVLKGNYGERQYRPQDISGAKVFDAFEAQWTVDNCGWTGSDQNNYPVLLESRLGGSEWYGGYFNSVIPQDAEWLSVYRCNDGGGNSAALLARGEIKITGIRIDGAWDGIRFDRKSSLRDSYISNTRDDGIEADAGQSFDVTNVLFDNVFVGISSTPNGNTSARIRLNNVLIKTGNYDYKGNIQPGSFIKGNEYTPGLEIHNTVFAFSKTSSIMNGRMKTAWTKIVSCSNNHLLWLDDGPIPSSFPLPPTCFRIVKGAEARTIWNQKRQEFLNSYPYRK